MTSYYIKQNYFLTPNLTNLLRMIIIIIFFFL